MGSIGLASHSSFQNWAKGFALTSPHPNFLICKIKVGQEDLKTLQFLKLYYFIVFRWDGNWTLISKINCMIKSSCLSPTPLQLSLFSGTLEQNKRKLAQVWSLLVVSLVTITSMLPSTLGPWGLPIRFCPCHCFHSLKSISSSPLFFFQLNKDL